MITEFTPWLSLSGGLLIGLSAILFMLTTGRVAGVSGIVAKNLPPQHDTSTWPQDLMFVLGLALAPLMLQTGLNLDIVQTVSTNYLLMGLGGFCVGLGTVLGNGCTSGHGVCGISLLSVRSIIATLVMMIVAALVVFVSRHVVGA